MKSAGRVSTRVVLLMTAALAVRAAAQNPPQPPPQDQRPVFRAATNVVRVDVYPRHRGRIVTGLTADDFRVTEDGAPQSIETFEFIPISDAASSEEPLEPRNADEARRMAADPRNRVFIFYLDAYSVEFFGSARSREPILDFLQRSMGPRDLFAVMTSVQSPELLEFTRLTQGLGSVLPVSKPWGLEDRIPEGPEEEQLEGLCGRGVVAGRRMLKVLNDLDGLVTVLGAMRPERKNLVFVGNRWQNEIGVSSGAYCRAPSAGAAPLFDAPGQRGRGSFQCHPRSPRARTCAAEPGLRSAAWTSVGARSTSSRRPTRRTSRCISFRPRRRAWRTSRWRGASPSRRTACPS
jgi:hypothetical protein